MLGTFPRAIVNRTSFGDGLTQYDAVFEPWREEA
jgi:hypothetical protein